MSGPPHSRTAHTMAGTQLRLYTSEEKSRRNGGLVCAPRQLHTGLDMVEALVIRN